MDASGNVYFADDDNGAIKEWNAATQTVSAPVSSGLSFPEGVALDGSGNVYIADTQGSAIKELPRAFVPAAAITEGGAAGSDSLSPVLPATAPLTGVFAPTSDQTWLTIGSVSGGAVSFSFTANTGAVRTAHITVLGQQITVTQKALPAFSLLTSPSIVYGTATTTLSGSISLVPNSETVSITLNGVVQTATVTAGAFSSSFNTSALGVAGSPYTITYAYAGDTTLAATSDTSKTVTVTQATPVFGSLSGPSIVYGTATTTLSGSISPAPTGSETVSITLDGVVQTATLAAGAFASSFNTSALGVAASPYTITYAYAGDANLAAASDTSKTVTVTQATPAFSSLSGPSIAYGTAATTLSGKISLVPDGESVSITLGGVQQTATVTAGAFSSSFNTSALGVASSPYTITYAYAGDANLAAANNASKTVTVAKATPVFGGLSGPTIAYGTATTTLSGTLSLAPDGETVSITVNGSKQTVALAGGAFSATFNTAALAVAGSPYTITYAYTGDANLMPASNASKTLTVTKATPAFSALSAPSIAYGTATTTLSGSISLAPNSETVSITVNGVEQTATVAGGAFSSTFNTAALGVAGSPYTITYAYAGDANLAAASNASKTLAVTKATPAFASLTGPTVAYGTAASLSGTISPAPNGETVSITVNGVQQAATVSAGAFSSSFSTSALGVAGSPYTITYAFAGDANLNPLSDTSKSLSVTKATPVFSSLSGPTIPYGTATTTLSGTISPAPNGESVSITLAGVEKSATVANGTFSSSFNTSALGIAGSPYAITYAYAGDANINPLTDASKSLTVTKATPVFSSLSGPTIVYGAATAALAGDISGVPNGESVSVKLNGVMQTATVAGGAFSSSFNTSALGVGSSPYTITYSYAGDSTLAAASDTSQKLTVTPATPTVTVSPVSITYGTALANAQLGGTAQWTVGGVMGNVPGSFAYTSAAGTVPRAGNGQSEAVTFTPADSTDYTTASFSATVNVAQATPTVAGVNPVTVTYGTALANGQLSGTIQWTVGGSTVSVAGTLAYTSAVGTVLNVGNGQSEAVTFTPTDATDYTTVASKAAVTVTPAQGTLPANLGIFNAGYWYRDMNGNGVWDAGDGSPLAFGPAGATPVAGDWDGSGKTEVGYYLNGTWYLDTTSGVEQFTFGFTGSDVVPVVGDWNGDGKTEVGVYANGAWFRDMDGSHTWDATNQAAVAYLGWAGASVIPVPGYWAGSGETQMGVYCNGVWFVDSKGTGQYNGTYSYWGWSSPSSPLVPVVGNWNGGGTKSQFGVYNQGVWFRDADGTHAWDAANQAAVAYFGWAGAQPVVGNWYNYTSASRVQSQPAAAAAVGLGPQAAAVPSIAGTMLQPGLLATDQPGGEAGQQERRQAALSQVLAPRWSSVRPWVQTRRSPRHPQRPRLRRSIPRRSIGSIWAASWKRS